LRVEVSADPDAVVACHCGECQRRTGSVFGVGPHVRNLEKRLFDAYAAEVARVNPNGNGIITAVVGDIDTATDGLKDNSRLFLPPTVFNRLISRVFPQSRA
jgi:hypothetical protein